MATYGGVKLVAGNLSIPQKTGDAESWRISQLLGPRTHGTQTTFAPENYAGLALDVLYKILVHNKIYISQTNFSYDLITEEIEETITIWNADQVPHVILSVETIGDGSGTELSGISVPKILTPETEIILTLKIYKDGHVTQSTQYLITFENGFVAILSISGKRIEAFLWEPIWDEIKISYRFSTIISRTSRFLEQRRAIINKPRRKIFANFLLDDLDQQKFVNDIKKLMAKSGISIPVYFEPITPKVNLIGLTIIETNETLTNYYNLNNLCERILIKSELSDINELKEIVSIGTNSIILSQPIEGNFKTGETIIYPTFIGMIDSISQFENHTDNCLQASLELREVTM